MSKDTQNESDKRKVRKFKFSAEEDELLKSLVEKHGTNNWTIIARSLKGRTTRQCRDRWNHYLSNDQSQFEWNEEEDSLLLRYYEDYGSRWTVISKFFVGRTAVSIRNRCCRLLRRANMQESYQNISSDKDQSPVILKPMNSSHNSQNKTLFPSCESLPFPFFDPRGISVQSSSLMAIGSQLSMK